MSVPAKAVFADPTLIDEPLTVAREVADVLDMPVPTVLKELTKPGVRFVYVARGVEPEVAAELERKALRGIGFLNESRRRYPGGTLAAHVLGMVGTDGSGLEGVEYRYDAPLAGLPGHTVVERDPSGRLIPQADAVDVPPVPGSHIVLTLDAAIQQAAERSLASAVQKNHAKGGTVIVMRPQTGEILAMASYPRFDPNDFAASSPALYANPAVTRVFEPGSVNKVITAAAVVDQGLVDLNQTFRVPSSVEVFDRTYTDDHPHPEQNMTLPDIIAHSSNVGTIEVAQKAGNRMLDQYLRGFGFGSRTGVGLPGESPGILPRAEEWWGTALPSIALGQSVSVTALQMASVYATIANGGVRVPPRVVLGARNPAGEFVPAPAPDEQRVVTSATAEAVTRMLAFAVAEGTGQPAQIEGYWVAGKTGTARKPIENGSGYHEDKHIASFIGFAPASRPAVVVAAMVDEPETVYGAIAAAPLFQDVARFALVHLRIAPAAKPPTPPHAAPTG
jgi:cell division protein FtsI (penicillin-binding protein 3)